VATLGPIAYSAVNTGTGVITTATLGANLIAGGFVVAGDGSEIMRSFIPDGYGVEVASDSTDVDWPHIPCGGIVESSKLIDWPSDTSLQAWVMDNLNGGGSGRGGKFTFDHLLNPS
jgi:hypothetical protein